MSSRVPARDLLHVDKLVYFEKFDFIDLAISREKQIKGYSRAKNRSKHEKSQASDLAALSESGYNWDCLCKNIKSNCVPKVIIVKAVYQIVTLSEIMKLLPGDTIPDEYGLYL